MSINIKETHRAKPTRPIKHSPIALSNNDILMPKIYFSVLYFFKNVNNENKFMNYRKLFSSLEDILSYYYPLAGLLKKEDEGRSSIVYSERGVPFVVAESPDITIMQLEEKNWDVFSISDKLVPVNNPVSVDAPLFAVQHTTLADESVVLGISMHHSVTDGCGFFSFLDNWGRKARQEPIIPPVHDRSLLKASGNPPIYEHDEYTAIKHTTTNSSDVKSNVPLVMPSMTKKLFYFSNDNLKKLHDAYSSKNSNDNWISTNDALVAHIWRIATRSRGIPLDTKVLCGMACNGRERLNPPLPTTYFGNCSLAVSPKMLVSELINGPRSNIALQIRNAITELDDSRIRSSFDWIEQQIKNHELKPNLQLFCGKDFVLSNWSKFPMYELDFGDGTPIKCCKQQSVNCDGVAGILGNNKNNDGLDVYISLITEHMQKLEQDPEFKEFQ